MFLNNRNSQSGQVLLIVVLVMVVSLTIGLSVISRSITNVRTSTEEANSAQALAAAEAGIQKSLNSQLRSEGRFAVGQPGSNYDSGFITEVTEATVDNLPLNGGSVVLMNEGIDLWLVPHGPSGAPNYTDKWDGTLNIYWGTGAAPSDCNDNSALEIVVFRSNAAGDLNDIRSVTSAVDPCARGSFTSVIEGSYPNIGGVDYRFRTQISITKGLIVRIIPIYFDVVIGVSKESGMDIPSQGSMIDSTGSSGEVKRKINVFQGYSFLPAEFATYGIFSPTDE